MTIPKNLGWVKSVHKGNAAPVNTNMLWFNDNIGEKKHYYYDVDASTWTPFDKVTVKSDYVDFPSIGNPNSIYVDLSEGKMYVYVVGTGYVPIGSGGTQYTHVGSGYTTKVDINSAGAFTIEVIYNVNSGTSKVIELFPSQNAIVSFNRFIDVVVATGTQLDDIPTSWNIPRFIDNVTPYTYSTLGWRMGEGSVYEIPYGDGGSLNYKSYTGNFVMLSEGSLSLTITSTGGYTSTRKVRSLTLTGIIKRY